jgi:transcriptional regulator with XRE-family HTH domain
MKSPQPALGVALQALRVERAKTQRATAAGAGITVAHLSKIERGHTNPTWASVDAIARSLGTSLAEVALRFERVRSTER